MITTTQNKQIKQIIKLKKSARERRKQELFLVEGIRMFTEIPEEYLYKVYASEDFYNEHIEKLVDFTPLAHLRQIQA